SQWWRRGLPAVRSGAASFPDGTGAATPRPRDGGPTFHVPKHRYPGSAMGVIRRPRGGVIIKLGSMHRRGGVHAAAVLMLVGTTGLARGVLYAGGNCTTVNGASHTYLAALNAATGTTDSVFTGSADNPVLASTMTADGSRLVIGGTFTHVDGSSESHIAALN